MDAKAFNLRRAFSLIEVVIATAIVAVGVTTILALLAALLKNPTHAGGPPGAIALASRIQNHLQRRSDVNGLERWVSDIPVASPDAPGFRLVASRKGDPLRSFSAAEAEVPQLDQFYLIELRRFPGAGPLGYETGAQHLVVNVVITWPYRILTPTGLSLETPPEARDAITFNQAIIR